MKKINRIFLFGDSWVEGQGTYEFVDKRNTPFNFREPSLPLEKLSEWRKQNSWNKFIKDLTNCEVLNYAIQGSNNYTQFQELNSIINTITSDDLVLFGFTSKLRDRRCYTYAYDLEQVENSKLLNNGNPLKSQLAWERISFKNHNFGITDSNNSSNYTNKSEKEFTKKFIKDFFSFIYDDYPLEYVSQVNYYFYQERFKSLNLNLVCFDLFEKYINPSYLKDGYKIDEDVYVTFNKQTMNDYLIEYEKNNIFENDISVWEDGKTRPDLENKIFHPNQHGYKLYVNYLFDEILSKNYIFNK